MAKFNSKTGSAAGSKSKRGKSLVSLIMKQTDNGNLLVKALVDIVTDPKTGKGDRIKAITKLLEYGYGRPVTQVDANVDGNIVISWEGDVILEE